MGDRTYLGYVIKNEGDWDSVEPLNVYKGTYGWHLEALRTILRQKEKNTPVIVTIFNPLSIAGYLAGDEVLMSNLRSHPERVEPAIKAITETCVNFSKAVIEEGADGIFLSTRFASFEIMDEREYRLFGKPGDLATLKAAEGGWFNILHLHGPFPMLAQLSDYPVHALNWHDRTTPFNLAEAGKLFPGTLMGGVEQYKLLRFGKPNEIEDQVRDAIRQMNDYRLSPSPLDALTTLTFHT